MQTLISQDQLQQRITALAQEISNDHPNGVHMVCVLKGAFMFLADLVRAMTCEVTLDFMAVSSYGLSTRSSGQVRVLKDLDTAVDGRSVIIVEDIVDTGLTLTYLQAVLRARGPRTLKTACLLSKPSRRQTDVPVEYVGFTIDDLFVVGYGLDSGERYRNLPYLAVVNDYFAAGFTAARTFAAHDRASAITAVASSVNTLRSRISTLPFTTVFRTSSP
jgi:hypoxanthine phosphoribosyltransferase